MRWRNSEHEWGAISKTLHWTIAVLVIGLAIVGLVMHELPTSLTKVQVYALHKSFGITVLVLMLLRIVWRLFERRPAYPSGMPAWQRRAAALTHGLLYLVLLVMPISGWLYNSASNFPLRWFGLFALPALSAPDPELKALAHEVHEIGFYVIAMLFALHVGAALKHHFVDRDNTLRGMLPFARSEKST